MIKRILFFGFVIALSIMLVGNTSYALLPKDPPGPAWSGGAPAKPAPTKPAPTKPAPTKPTPTKPTPPEPTPPPPPPVSVWTNKKTNDLTAKLEPQKKLYKLGDEISLTGKRDVFDLEQVSKPAGSTDDLPKPKTYYDIIKNKEVGYYVNVTFKGFRVSCNGEKIATASEGEDTNDLFLDNYLFTHNWKMKKLKIVELVPSEYGDYNSNTGVATGQIIVRSDCGSEVIITVLFQFTPEGYTVDVYSDNPYLGTVSDSLIGKFEGQEVTVSANEKVEGAFKYWYKKNLDGTTEIVSYNKEHTFVMPDSNIVLVAHFECFVQTHKLYVTSNNPEWGETWTYDNNNQKTTYVEKAVPNKKYDLKYQEVPGYKFVRWEYRPYFDNELEGNGKIKMPEHDITVTAIFEKENKSEEESLERELIITVNNPKWGTAGDSVVGVISGAEYPIWASPNEGYYFTGWIYSPTYLGNPLTLNSSIIMPEKTITVTAFFSPITDMYDVTTKVEPPFGGKVIGNIPESAAPGQKFEISVEENDGYVFDYWYYIDPDGNKVIISRDLVTIITMPAHSTELIAVFKEIGKYNLYVTSNNTKWGEAWTTPDNSDEHIWERMAVEGEEYSINVLPNRGYEFVELVYKPDVKNPLESKGKIRMPAHDITVTAIFKESKTDLTEEPTLFITVNNPKWGKAYIVDKEGNLIYASENPMDTPNSFTAEAGETYKIYCEAKPGYEFVGWHTSPDIDLAPFADDITMPTQNLNLTAFFAPMGNKHSLIVKSEPENGGEVIGTRKEIFYGESTLVEAIPANSYELEYWYYFDENSNKIIESKEDKFYFEMPNYDVELYGKFRENSGGDELEQEPIEPSEHITPENIPTPSENTNNAISLSVSSVRDLRWRDRFVDKYGNYISSNVLRIPTKDELLVKHTKYPDALKMGYAVEFGLKTIMVPEDYAKLVVKPQIYMGNKKIEFSEIRDDLSGELLSKSDRDYSKITILGTDTNISDAFQTKATATYPRPENNGVEYDEITWSWVYYLPAKVSDINFRPFENDLTIKFNIELYDTRKGKVLDYVTALNRNDISYWTGKAFKYSHEDSLLDDIYDNATN